MFDLPGQSTLHGQAFPAVVAGVCRSLEHPAQLGNGTNHATSCNFLGTFFTITPFSIIVNSTSGTNPGQTAVQGGIDSTGLWRRKRVARA